MSKNISLTYYYDWDDSLSILDPLLKGEVFQSIVNYCRYGTEPPEFEDKAAEMAKSFIIQQLKRNEAKVSAGKLGGIASGKSRREKKENGSKDAAANAGEQYKKDQPAPDRAKADANGVTRYTDTLGKNSSLSDIMNYQRRS